MQPALTLPQESALISKTGSLENAGLT